MKLALDERRSADYKPLTVGLGLVITGVLCGILAPAYSLAAFVLALLVWALYCLTPAEDRRVVLWVVGLSLAFRLVMLVALHQLTKAQGLHGFLSGDGRLYFLRAWELAEYLKGASDTAFSKTHGVNGYVYFAGFFIGLTRPSVFMLKVFNVSVGLAASFGFYRWVRGEFGRRAGLVVLVLLAFYPSLMYWSITDLKEPHMVLILMVGLWCVYCLSGGERLWPFWAAVVAGMLALLGTYNPYVAAILGFAVVLGGSLGRFPRQVALASASTLAGGIWLYWNNELVANKVKDFLYIKVMVHQSTIASSDFAGYVLFPYNPFRGLYHNHFGPHNELYAGAWLASWLKGFWYFLFSPFPWAIQSLGQLQAYPQTILWYGLFPFVLYGAWVWLKARRQQVLPVVVYVVSLTALLALVTGNIGQAFRHRDWVSPFFLMFAAVGLLYFLKEPELVDRVGTSSRPERC